MSVERSQAEAIVAIVQAYFPRPELPESTVKAWAFELENCNFSDAKEATRRLSRERAFPTLRDLLDLTWEVASERVAAEAPPALPSPQEFLAAMPDDVRERVKRMREAWRIDAEGTDAENDEEWERRKEASRRGPHMRKGSAIDGGTLCPGSAEPPIKRKGKLSCPGCGVEVLDFVFRIPAKKRSEETA